MSALWISILILLAAASALFLGAGWRQRQTSDLNRDRLNTDFYHHRLRELEEPYRKVFLLSVLGGSSFKDISRMFKKSESWARVTFYRAKQKLSERME